MGDEVHVPNLRGGPPVWLVFIVGPLLGAIVVAVGAVWAIARMPDGTQFHEITTAVAAIKQEVAVSHSQQDGDRALNNERFEGLKVQLKEIKDQIKKRQ